MVTWQKSGESRLIFTGQCVILFEVAIKAAKETLARMGLAGLLILTAAGCDLFRTRSVEPPLDQGSSVFYPDPVEPDTVFMNLKNSLAYLNYQEYTACFFAPGDPVGTYQFIPDPGVSGWPPSLSWGYAEESQTIQYLFSLTLPGSPPFLSLTEENRTTYADSIKISQTYHLVATTSDPTLPQDVRGQADFVLARTETGFWAILRWTDLHGLNGYPSWTALKAGLYSP